jgi:hypothetical protein
VLCKLTDDAYRTRSQSARSAKAFAKFPTGNAAKPNYGSAEPSDICCLTEEDDMEKVTATVSLVHPIAEEPDRERLARQGEFKARAGMGR